MVCFFRVSLLTFICTFLPYACYMPRPYRCHSFNHPNMYLERVVNCEAHHAVFSVLSSSIILSMLLSNMLCPCISLTMTDQHKNYSFVDLYIFGYFVSKMQYCFTLRIWNRPWNCGFLLQYYFQDQTVLLFLQWAEVLSVIHLSFMWCICVPNNLLFELARHNWGTPFAITQRK